MIISFNSFSIKVSSFISSLCIYLILSSEPTSFQFLIGRQFFFLELQLINSREATVLLSFVFKDSQQQHYLLPNMIMECHVRSDLSLPSARANQIDISSFCLLFHLFCPLFHYCAGYFNKNSKTANQSDLRNNAQHVIKAMFTLYRNDFRSGSGIDPIQCEQCLGKSNQTGPVWS